MPMINPKEPLSVTEKHVFGYDAKRHLVLGFVIEQSERAESMAVQVDNYISMVANTEGSAAAQKCIDALKAAEAAKAARVAVVATARPPQI
jgi:hypothetical protein